MVLLDHAEFLLLQIGLDVAEHLDAHADDGVGLGQHQVVHLLQPGQQHVVVVPDAHRADRLQREVLHVRLAVLQEVEQRLEHLLLDVRLQMERCLIVVIATLNFLMSIIIFTVV